MSTDALLILSTKVYRPFLAARKQALRQIWPTGCGVLTPDVDRVCLLFAFSLPGLL